MKDFDIFNSTPREIKCIRSDNNVWKEGGDPKHLLEVDKTYHLARSEVYNDYTILVLVEFPKERFNSVLFAEVD